MANAVQSFALELRRLCEQRGSIAAICRGTGINRQQFNKYLAGRMLPGSMNMRKICSFLGVSEAELFGRNDTDRPSDYPRGERAVLSKEMANDYWEILTSQLRRPAVTPFTDPSPRMPNGFYELYLPVRGACHMLVCWLLTVSDSGKGQIFTCRKSAQGPEHLGGRSERVRFRGIVLPGLHDVLLVGAAELNQPSVISVGHVQQEGRRHFPALALTRRDEGAFATSAVLHYRGTACNARQALARTGVISVFNPRLDAVVAGMMSSVQEGDFGCRQSSDVAMTVSSGDDRRLFASGTPAFFSKSG